MGLFDQHEADNLENAKPLAARMRPRSLDEFVGQEISLRDEGIRKRVGLT